MCRTGSCQTKPSSRFSQQYLLNSSCMPSPLTHHLNNPYHRAGRNSHDSCFSGGSRGSGQLRDGSGCRAVYPQRHALSDSASAALSPKHKGRLNSGSCFTSRASEQHLGPSSLELLLAAPRGSGRTTCDPRNPILGDKSPSAACPPGSSWPRTKPCKRPSLPSPEEGLQEVRVSPHPGSTAVTGRPRSPLLPGAPHPVGASITELSARYTVTSLPSAEQGVHKRVGRGPPAHLVSSLGRWGSPCPPGQEGL